MTTRVAMIARVSAAAALRRSLPTSGALLQRPMPVQARSFGVFSSIRDTVTQKMQDRNDEKQAEAYRQQIQDLAGSSKFDLNTFHEQLKKNADASGLNGWKGMIPGVSEMTAVQQMKAFMEILEAIEPQHRENPYLINGKVKRKITEKCGHSAEEINNMIRQYEQMSALHQWLSKRVQRGLSLPETYQETQDLIREDPTGFPAHKFRMKQRRY
ncbi:hypothetical protein P43SY_002769 [Pythium insidiosum]|uniref:Signal recognition particle SRP54 subunit M-domain domain-containing protein n=1 Tax=Pythium insidiosum TaxID=114742 RepID=A0AAD5LUP7_PYTIN|nr:hypothetical protein P43SY_002769 [Pythium insidiosum]